MSTESTVASSPTPPASAKESPWRADILSGFLVFLIALPLCLGIATASGFPTLSGIITAIIGGLLVTFLGGAPMTIKGPAAGLIVIALGAMTDFGAEAAAQHLDPSMGYRWALATITVAGVIQAGLGLAKAGKLGDAFPTTVVHGMLAAIGIIIISKQAHAVFGVAPTATTPISLYEELPHSISVMNPAIFLIGVVSLAILFTWPLIKNPMVKKVPAPLVVLLVGIPLGMLLGVSGGESTHYSFLGHDYAFAPRHLVTINGTLRDAITFPDFSMITSTLSMRYIVMFTLVGSIESLLSGKAIEQLDPLRRASDLNRDLLGVGIGNAIAGMLGGLPMIAEIVRSSANLNNGAQTRMANFFHGLFLLAFVILAPALIHLIPSAALAAMLCYTGTRLASPTEFKKTFQIGGEQLVIFLVTIAGCVGEDLLVGVALGIVTKLVFHVVNGAPVGSLFSAKPEVKVTGDTATVTLHGSALFSNYLGIKGSIEKQSAQKHVIVDVGDCRLVDHTVMEHFHELEKLYPEIGRSFHVRGLDSHKGLSDHPQAARKKLASLAAAA